jgi:hypothetical protein
MNQIIKMAIKSLPENFRKVIHDHIRLYSVTMLLAEDMGSEDVTPCSGTLCSFSSKFGIVTARHVWDEVRIHEKLLIMSGSASLQIKTADLNASVPKHSTIFPKTNARVPDIAFIHVDAEKKAQIEALGKVFYSIDRRKEKTANICTESGYWTFFGNPNALIDRAHHTLKSFIYGTQATDNLVLDGWDYIIIALNIPENPDIPKDYSGVSGGGVWRTNWGCDRERACFVVPNVFEDCIFSGVCFYQTGEKERSLIAHGPISIYKMLFDFLLQVE